MTSVLKKKDLKAQQRRAQTATEIIANLAHLEGWILDGDGTDVAIQKTFTFAHFLETISFVNAVAFVAERFDHHPDLHVQYAQCVVRFHTHDVGGISSTDFECAAAVDALTTSALIPKAL
jgi:4a-hydroxytetrahydrobiopterin dehydratase